MPRLAITCPTCGYVGPCDQGTNAWRGQKELPLKVLPLVAGQVGYHIAYRVRSRRCDSTKCNQPFDTVELPREAFDAILKKLISAREDLEKIDKVTAPIFEQTRKIREKNRELSKKRPSK